MMKVESKVIAMIVAPFWTQHRWFGVLAGFATHCWILQQEDETFLPLSTSHSEGKGVAPWQVGLWICDFRKKSSLQLIFKEFPTIAKCLSISKQKSLLKEIKEVFGNDIRPEVSKSPFNAKFLDEVSKGVVPDDMREVVISSLKQGFKRGLGSCKSLPAEEERKIFEKMEKEVKKGFCLGPFDQCPFPSKWCDKQAIICMLFFRPKHKFTDDGLFRLIAHRSFPEGISFNDLIERKDSSAFIPNYKYFTVRDFIQLLAKLGKGTLIKTYKQCRMAEGELWQQVYKVGKKFFIDLGGMFGSRNAGDAWNLLMELMMSSLTLQITSRDPLTLEKYF